jgi:exodeoxyribonuclease V alpha subunit
MDTLSGSVERITFYNPENGYSVIRLRPDQRKVPGLNREGIVTAVGNLPEITPGEHLHLQGTWINHPKHGLQFQIEICEQKTPATLEGLRRYLGSGLIKGIGPHLAERIIKHFGLKTLEVIEQNPERLMEVADIGPKRTSQIAQAWEEQKQVKEIMLFLHSHGVSTNLATKIYKQYGDQALDVVRNDPYRLARDIYGVGFKTADRIAQALGLPADHPSRIEAGIVYVLNEMTSNGHVYSPGEELVQRSSELLDVSGELIPPALERLELDDRIQREVVWTMKATPEQRIQPQASGHPSSIRERPAIYDQPAVYLTPLYVSEIGVADRLRDLSSAFPSNLSDIPPMFLDLDPQLSEDQKSAVKMALTHPVSVLTGGPGTGKTTCIRSLIAALESARKRYALASPTGRAAKRLSEATGRPASTLHRLLGFTPGEGFKHNADNPLKIDLLVVDEASMLDLLLTLHMLKALSPGTHLLLVGDIDQLPSVGAGDVLNDIIGSDIAQVTRLNVIFRQAAGSQIISNAHRINQGMMPTFPRSGQDESSAPGDFYLFPTETPEDAADWVLDVVTRRIPDKFGLNPHTDIQVLSPMYRGAVGVDALNERLQNALNPPQHNKTDKKLFGQLFRTGDKVMQTLNNYDKEVFNGDIGHLIEISEMEHTVSIDFEGRNVTYDWTEMDQIVLAYAVSVHKAQGSEFPGIVIPLVTAHYMMLQRNLLYTAVTRAKKLCVLVGSKRAIGIAVRNNKVSQRYSALEWRLTDIR